MMEGSGSVFLTNGSGSRKSQKLPYPEHCFYGFNGTCFLWQFAYGVLQIWGFLTGSGSRSTFGYSSRSIRIRERKKFTCPDSEGKKFWVHVPIFFKCNFALQCFRFTCVSSRNDTKTGPNEIVHKEMVMFCHIWKGF